MKKCNKCKQRKSPTDFYKMKSEWDGLAGRCKECSNSTAKLYYKKNRETILSKKRYVKKPKRSFLRSTEKYCIAYRAALHRAKRLGCVPPWADLKKIESFYKEAADLSNTTGIKYEVDHIIPLAHKKVSGLHVPDNLQVITESANRKKFNRFVN